MCPLLRSGGIIVVSLFVGALSVCSVSAFRPPAFSDGRQAAARAKTTVIAYVENPDEKDERASVHEERLKEAEAKTMNVQFEMIDGKIDAMALDLNVKFDATNSKIDANTKDLKGKIDAVAKDLSAKIDANTKDLNGKIDAVAKDLSAKIDANTKDLNGKIDDIKTDMSKNQLATTTEFGKIDRGIAVIICLGLIQNWPSILSFFK